MDSAPKPIKRSKELAPLSREHHEGLLFVWKIRQGLKNGTDINTIAAFVQWFWEADLKRHFQMEEKLLAPLLKSEPLITRMIEEHQELEALIHINEQIGDADLLAKIADTVNDHIRFEERVLFPFIEGAITPEQLKAIGEQLGAPSMAGSNWEQPFWEQKG